MNGGAVGTSMSAVGGLVGMAPSNGGASPSFSLQVPMPSLSEKSTLWMGDLEPWMDENFVKQIWYDFGEQVNVKVIRNKLSGYVLLLLCDRLIKHFPDFAF